MEFRHLEEHFTDVIPAYCLKSHLLGKMKCIIIIIWHYNPLWIFAFAAKSVQVLLSRTVSFQFLTFSFFRSSLTSSCHRCCALPIGLVPIGFQSNSFLVGLHPFALLSSFSVYPTGYTWLRFHSKICFFRNWISIPMSNPHLGGPGFVFRVFSPRWISFAMPIEALLPLVFFQGFPSLFLWGFFPSPTRQRWQCLFAGGTYSPVQKTVLENMWFLMVVVLPQATPSLSDSLAAQSGTAYLGFRLFAANHHIWWPFTVHHLQPAQ